MKITAWKCTDTGKIFEDIMEYNIHRAAQLQVNRNIEKQIQFISSIRDFWETAGSIVKTPTELAEYLHSNWQFLENVALKCNQRRYRRSKHNTLSVSQLKIENVTWDPLCKKWYGEISAVFDGPTKMYLGDFFFHSSVTIRTKYSVEDVLDVQTRHISIPASCFPKMVESKERADMMNILADKKQFLFL